MACEAGREGHGRSVGPSVRNRAFRPRERARRADRGPGTGGSSAGGVQESVFGSAVAFLHAVGREPP